MQNGLANKAAASMLRCGGMTAIALLAFGVQNIQAVNYAGGDYDGDRRADPVKALDDNFFAWCSAAQYRLQGPYDFAIEGGAYLSADFDGDSIADVAIVDGSGNWYLGYSSGSYQIQGPYNLACAGGIPLAADMDGDGKADPVEVIGGHWYVWSSSGQYQIQGPYDFSFPGAVPVAGDIDGDGKADPVMVSSGDWRVWYSSAGYQLVGPVALGVAGHPVLSDFDGDAKADPAVVDNAGLWHTWLSGGGYQPRGPFALPLPSQTPLVAAVVMREKNNETYALASVANDYTEFADCAVSVNQTPLAYGLPVDFTNADGLVVALVLPVYYANLTNVNPGTTVAVAAYNSDQELLFQSDPVVMPEQVGLQSPADGQALPAGQDAALAWSVAAGAQGYLTAYLADGVTGNDAAAGCYVDFADAAATNSLVPSASLLEGAGTFSVSALAGDTNVFGADDQVSASFLLVGTGDSAEAIVTNIPTLLAKGSVALAIAKAYRKDIKGITFTIREYNPQQIQQAGTAYIQIKMPKWHLTAAFIKAYDMKGKEYFSWEKVRQYKSDRKRYCHTISIQPFTTIVIGEKTSEIEAANYNY